MRPVPNLDPCPQQRSNAQRPQAWKTETDRQAERVLWLLVWRVTGDRVCKVPGELRQPILALLLPDRRHGVRPHQRRILAPTVALSPVLPDAAGERVGRDVHIPVVTTLRFRSLPDFYRPEEGVGSGCLPEGLVQTISLHPLRVYGPEVVQAATAGLLP